MVKRQDSIQNRKEPRRINGIENKSQSEQWAIAKRDLLRPTESVLIESLDQLV